MSIIRAPRPVSNFYVLDKALSEDQRLGWAARGLLIYLLGKPDHWQVSVEHLRRQTAGARIRTGRDGIYALLDELKATGYVRTSRARRKNGTLGPLKYLVREAPLQDQPEVVDPVVAQPDTAEPTLASTEGAARTDRFGESASHARARSALPDGQAAEIVKVLRDHGFQASVGDPRIRQAVAAGVTADSVAETAEAFGSETAFHGSPSYILRIATNNCEALAGRGGEWGRP